MTDLEYKMGQLVERIDGLIARMDRDDETRKEERAAAAELELRVRSLEESRSKLKGWAAAAGAIGAALGWLISLLTK